MGFSDTLKELLDQGMVVSKDLAAKAGEKAQDLGAKGMEASRGFAAKAGAKLQELGEKGVLTLEIKQLEGQIKKLIGLLGAEVYRFMEQGGSAANDAESPPEAENAANENSRGFPPEIRKIYDQITSVKETIERKETELKNIGAKGEK